MKRWSLTRKTLGFFGITKEELNGKEAVVTEVDADATVHYEITTSAGTQVEFSGNMLSGEHGINDDVIIPDVPGEIIIVGDNPLYMNSGDTYTLILIDEEDNAILLADVTITSSNTNVIVSGLDLTAVGGSESTVTVRLNADNNVFTKLKIYIG